MSTKVFKAFSAIVALTLVLTGCATTRARQAQTDPQTQITQLQSELQAKNQQIQEMQSTLEKYEQSLRSSTATPGGKLGKSSIIEVAGVTVRDVQGALVKAGYDPGPVDGRVGKKTKHAIKAFQRKHGLFPDGVIGDKTWALLNK